MWDLTVSVPDHCLSFYFAYNFKRKTRQWYSNDDISGLSHVIKHL